MSTMGRVSCVGLLGLALTLVPGCGPTPADKCLAFEDEVRAMLTRCSIPGTFHVLDPVTGMPACGVVHNLSRYDEITNVCYPFLRSVDCSTIDRANVVASFPPECSGDHFIVRH